MQKLVASYAQNKEDIILASFFPDVENGFYVDVGANHPIKHSVTKLFYTKGWTGIDIEPNASLCDMLRFDRPKDLVLNIGASNSDSELEFTEYANHGLSTFSEEMVKEHAQHSSVFTDKFRRYKVPVRRLKDIFSEAKVTKINFMKVDVEGFEYEVLDGNDWDRYRPEMICIESNHLFKDWRPLLKNHKYNLVFNDGLNDYYLAEESSKRAKKFSYAKSLLENGEIVTLDVYRKVQEEERKSIVLDIRLDETARLKAEAEWQANWYEHAPFKWYVYKSFKAFDTAITRRMTEKPKTVVTYDEETRLLLQSRSSIADVVKLRNSYTDSISTTVVYPGDFTKLSQKFVWKAYSGARKAAKSLKSKGAAR